MMNDNVCRCPHHMFIPLLAIVLGIVFLLGNYGTISWSAVHTIWPILLIVGGAAKIMSRKCSCCRNMHMGGMGGMK